MNKMVLLITKIVIKMILKHLLIIIYQFIIEIFLLMIILVQFKIVNN